MIERLGQKGTRRWAGARRPSAPARDLAYNELKATWQRSLVMWMGRCWGGAKFCAPVRISAEFYELDRHRDPDGVASGAMKLILDAMVAGEFLASDGAASVRRLGPFDFFYPGEVLGRMSPTIVVDVNDANATIYRAILPVRLPDWNELRAAVELGVRRQLRKAARP